MAEANALGYTSFDGLALGGNAVLVKYTSIGDLNLDGTVDASDIAPLSPNFGLAATSWTRGDVNYDDKVNQTDLALITLHYGQSAYPPTGGLVPATRTLSTAPAIATSPREHPSHPSGTAAKLE